VAVGLGANLGDARATVLAAARALAAGPVKDARLSALYGTAPIGPPQPDYTNAVLVGCTALSPRGMLQALQSLEAAHGRVRGARWGARTLDLDLLVWGDATVAEPDLSVPHPGIADRGFVLVPLCDLWPDHLHPTLGQSYRELLAAWRGRTPGHDGLVWRLGERRPRSLPEVA
jgi:2-amino-4-hydroxy-6-hydroxymethyldihydropteridine diphosphokinase